MLRESAFDSIPERISFGKTSVFCCVLVPWVVPFQWQEFLEQRAKKNMVFTVHGHGYGSITNSVQMLIIPENSNLLLVIV